MSTKTGFLKRKDSRRQKMLRCRASAVVLTLVFPLVCNGPNFAVSPAQAQGTDEKTVPQGQDPPGADNEQPFAPPTQKDGVNRSAMRTSTPTFQTPTPVTTRKG